MSDLEFKLPEDVLENIPSGKQDLINHLAKYFETVIDRYDLRFQKRVAGPLGAPLSRYEKSILRDFLLDIAIGKIEESKQEDG